MTYEKNLIDRITYHLSSGGLFNPELADHLAVRNLLMECREALAQPEQEPVAWMHMQGNYREACFWELDDDDIGRGWTQVPLYTTPPQRKPLTDEQIEEIAKEFWLYPRKFVRAIEAAHGIKGEA